VLHVVGQGAAGGVPVLGPQGHRLRADGLQGRRHRPVHLARRRELPPLHLGQDAPDIAPAERGPAGQQVVEGGAEAVDVTGRPQLVHLPRGLLRAHVLRRAEGLARLRGRRAAGASRGQGGLGGVGDGLLVAQGLGQPPVHDQGLAVLAQHHVARLEVPVQDAPAVGVSNGVAHVHEPTQQPPQLQPALPRVLEGVRPVEAVDGLLEAVAPDEAHGVVGPAVRVGPQAVDGHNAGVLQPAGHLRLQQEARAAIAFVGVAALDLLEGHLPVQLLVMGHEHLAQPAPGVWPEDAVALPGPGGGGRGEGRAVIRGPRRGRTRRRGRVRRRRSRGHGHQDRITLPLVGPGVRCRGEGGREVGDQRRPVTTRTAGRPAHPRLQGPQPLATMTARVAEDPGPPEHRVFVLGGGHRGALPAGGAAGPGAGSRPGGPQFLIAAGAAETDHPQVRARGRRRSFQDRLSLLLRRLRVAQECPGRVCLAVAGGVGREVLH
jgi:hypothetical protein